LRAVYQSEGDSANLVDLHAGGAERAQLHEALMHLAGKIRARHVAITEQQFGQFAPAFAFVVFFQFRVARHQGYLFVRRQISDSMALA
jgi:hypothetical protein